MGPWKGLRELSHHLESVLNFLVTVFQLGQYLLVISLTKLLLSQDKTYETGCEARFYK